METSAPPPSAAPSVRPELAPGQKGLKPNAIGYISNLVIAVASTAPAYSLAATLGFIVAVGGVGVHAPAVLIVSFIPILFVSVGYRFLNLADPDAGTTFAWVTRAFGPQLGWVNGWAIFLADIIVMASLAAIASNYTFLLFSSSGAPSNFWLIVGAVVWIVVMTWICYRGIELSARIQSILLSFEIATLAVFAVVALVKVYANSPTHSIQVSASWFNPFDLGWGALIDGVLLGIFIYWGWDSGVAVNEESRDRTRGPGKAAVISTVVLLLIYVIVSAAAQAYHGTNVPLRQLKRCAQRARRPGPRLWLGQAPDHRRAHLGFGLDPDDDPAHRADHVLDGPLAGDPASVWEGPSPVLDSHLLDASHGRSVDRLDGRVAGLQLQPGCARRRDLRPRLLGLLLLRVHRTGLRLLLPPGSVQERP